MKKNFFCLIALCAATMTLPFLTSCSDDDDPTEEPELASEYIYVLNCGKMNSNNATLSMYDIEKETVVRDIFEVQNGRRLGDTGQDMVVYGSKIYIAVYGESTVEVTDLEAKSIKQIKTEGQPRSFAIYGGKVYATYFNGYVARIDTASLAVEAKIQVGRNPDQLTVANNKLYVANSGGLDFGTDLGADKTVSVIDIASFTETKKIEVVVNPTDIESDSYGNVYVISAGNYADILNTLQKIEVNTDKVSVIDNATLITVAGNTLYSVFAQYGAATINYFSYNTANSSILSNNFIGNTKISNPNKMNYDANYEHLFITTSDYTNDGDVYVFDKSNNFVTKFEVGLNPMKAVYIKK